MGESGDFVAGRLRTMVQFSSRLFKFKTFAQLLNLSEFHVKVIAI